MTRKKARKTQNRNMSSSLKSASAKSGSEGSKAAQKGSRSSSFRLEPKKLKELHDLMVKSRTLEERLIKMYKQNDGYFWIGAPGEEAFSVPLGLLVNKGQGVGHDYLHLHYRGSPILVAMGMNPMDAIRQMKNTATDPFSGGRNFGNHFSVYDWNVVPITSTIETQYATAIGTAIAQSKAKNLGITIVTGGDAGTAEGEFASSLVWASRPGRELPMLIVVTNNEWGISTPGHTQRPRRDISDRGKAFGMRTQTIDGNDVEESWFALKEAMDYVRKERKPFLLEAKTSRLYGHSSATGANYVESELDCLKEFEVRLEKGGILSRKEMDRVRERYTEEMLEMWKQARVEPMPDPSTIYDHTFFGQKGKYL